jgi:two-component system NtrC family sensor kinase
MTFLRSIRLGLAAKLAVCVIVSTAVFFIVFGFINFRTERRQSEGLMVQSADRVADIILRSTRYDMMRHDRDALHNVLQEVGSEPGIQRIRIFNRDGRIIFSTEAREIDTAVDKSAEACYGCHAQSQPLAKLNRPDRARPFWDKQGHHLIAVIRPIANAPECSSAACHVHDAGQRVLGVVDAQLSLAPVDAQIAQNQASLGWFLLGGIVLGSGLAVAFIWRVVYQPVKELIDGTHRVREGDLEYRLPVRSDDELGYLAASFNKMTAEVAGVQAKIEEQVRRKTAELERIHRTLLSSEKMASIGKLAATVAHEINNPLFGILTYARLVERGVLKSEIPNRDEMAEQLRTIERESKRCGELVKNLLTFSRQKASEREPNDLNTIVSRAVLLVKHKLEMQNIELVERLAEGLPPVDCDANQIQQVALVLMMNASEAMPSGGRLEVITELDGASGEAALRVKDTGCGIPEDVLPRIFDPFFTTKEDQNRTGLGLAVAHSIVEQHGGEIKVDSAPGQGTEFRVALPLSAAAVAAASR